MSRRTLAAAVVLVLAAIGLFLLLRGEGGAESEADRQARLAREAQVAAGGGQASGGAKRPPSRVRLEGTSTGTGAGTGSVRTYVTDTGNLVRDHRSDVHEPIAVPAPLPPEQRTMSSGVTAEIGGKLLPLVRSCGADVPADARGEAPVVHVTLTVDIAGEVLTSSAATAVTSDVTGASADRVIECVRDRAVGLTVPAKGEPDRSDYIVQYPVRLR